MPDGWIHWNDIPEAWDAAFTLDDEAPFLHTSEGSAHIQLSPLGLAVRAALLAMEGGDHG